MKKLVSLLLVLLCVFTLWASSELFIQSSDEVALLQSLVRESGKVMPNVIYPVSGDYLLSVIEDMDLKTLVPPFEKENLENLIARLKGSNLHRLSDDFKFDADVYISPTLYYNSDSVSESLYSDKVIPFNEMPPIVKGTADLWMTKYAFGHMEYEYSKRMDYYLKEGFVLNNPLGIRNMTVPFNTYLGAGTEHFNIFAGRVRVSSGSGVTGNLGIGDNFLFRNTIKLGLYTKPFTYEFLINTFDTEVKNQRGYQPSLDTDRPLVMLHKATLTLKDKVSVGLYEAMLDYSSASAFDPKVANPFLLMHNLLSYRYKTNNFFGAEVDVAVSRGVTVHGQFFFDQINLSGEEGKNEPSAYGFLFNVKYSGWLKGNKFNSYAEFAYTNPWAYLKPETFVYNDTAWVQQLREEYYYRFEDLVVGNYHSGPAFDTGYVGYKYGPNAVVIACGGDLEIKNNHLSADLMLKFNGDTGYMYPNDMAVGNSQKTRNAVSPFCYTEGNKKQVLVQLILSDKFKLKEDSVTVNATCGLQKYVNYNFIKGNDRFNVLFSLGVTLKPLDWFKW